MTPLLNNMTLPLRTIDQTISALQQDKSELLHAPAYTGSSSRGIALAVESMKDHMTNEGWEIMQALHENGYELAGHKCPIDTTDITEILQIICDLGIVVIQDKREWDVHPSDFRDRNARFTNVGSLRDRPDLFKLTVLKDAHHNNDYHRWAAWEIDCHAWIIYYHPRIVAHLAPYVRPQHLIRTYHSLDSQLAPQYSPDGRGICLLSGAHSSHYPLRTALVNASRYQIGIDYLPHPGYHRKGCATPQFLKTLSRYKVAICTSSKYGYALRKIIEATACGCIVVTDLPTDEVLPEIDGNLVRVPHTSSPRDVHRLVRQLAQDYDPIKQEDWAIRAQAWYDYRAIGKRLVNDIEQLRINYANASQLRKGTG